MRFRSLYIFVLPKVLLINILVLALLVSTAAAESVQTSDAQAQPFTQNFSSQNKTTSLVELYSSQGCSSCPPAQDFVNQLRQEKGLWKDFVPVVFHVDYWDYLGWKDPYSAPQFSARQRQHAELGNVYSVYTPGFVVDGREWRGFFSRKPFSSKRSKRSPGMLKIDVSSNNQQMMFKTHFFADEKPLTGISMVNIAILGMDLTTKVSRGENAKRQLDEEFIVLHHVQEKFVQGGHINIAKSDIASSLSSNHLALAVWVSDLDGLSAVQAVGGMLDEMLYKF